MKVNYSNQDAIVTKEKSIFLAGSISSKCKEDESWREEAVRILKMLDFKGVVYYPEYANTQVKEDCIEKYLWEKKAISSATCIVFWIDKEPTMYQNLQFTYWIAKNGNKIIYGRPKNFEKAKHLEKLYKEEKGKNPINNLEDLMLEAVINVSEEKIFGYNKSKVKKLITEVPSNGCTCPSCMQAWREDLQLKFITLLKKYEKEKSNIRE